ncbi:MAG: branched-chain amino acid ABC transporter permease [Xanthobacteraceae bacterium]|jgi:branched-chain amino acid transport system permease protein
MARKVWSLRVLLASAATVAFMASVPLWGNEPLVGVGINLLAWVALSASWIVFSGLTGYISLGHAVFYGIGGYVTALLWLSVPMAVSVAAGGVAAALLALVAGYPCLRVRGPYFVMLTFGLSQFVKFVVIEIETALQIGGRLILGAPELETIYWLFLAAATAAVVLLAVIRYSRFGSGLRAIREDEVAAETIGVPTVKYKVIAFAISAIIPGLVGGIMLMRSGYLEPDTIFDPTVSLTMICIAVIGGGNTPATALLGSLFLVGLSETLWVRFPLVYMILLGCLLVTFVLALPQGLLGLLTSVTSRVYGRGEK